MSQKRLGTDNPNKGKPPLSYKLTQSRKDAESQKIEFISLRLELKSLRLCVKKSAGGSEATRADRSAGKPLESDHPYASKALVEHLSQP